MCCFRSSWIEAVAQSTAVTRREDLVLRDELLDARLRARDLTGTVVAVDDLQPAAEHPPAVVDRAGGGQVPACLRGRDQHVAQRHAVHVDRAELDRVLGDAAVGGTVRLLVDLLVLRLLAGRDHRLDLRGRSGVAALGRDLLGLGTLGRLGVGLGGALRRRARLLRRGPGCSRDSRTLVRGVRRSSLGRSVRARVGGSRSGSGVLNGRSGLARDVLRRISATARGQDQRRRGHDGNGLDCVSISRSQLTLLRVQCWDPVTANRTRAMSNSSRSWGHPRCRRTHETVGPTQSRRTPSRWIATQVRRCAACRNQAARNGHTSRRNPSPFGGQLEFSTKRGPCHNTRS